MSFHIDCPHCGRRPVEEFFYGEVASENESIAGADARNLDRVFMLDNPEGIATERWFHAYGCRRWLTLRRDTRK
ncbi:MAG: sarcosine oxidase subunit delta [Acidobacteriia bacterium]|nr:sarcosine oxidase subunit delta [Terriglobia bacterium]